MLSIECPHCRHKLTDEELKRLRGQLHVKSRWQRTDAVAKQHTPAPKPITPARLDREYDFGA